MKFEEASTATKRRKLMSVEENFMTAEIQDAFLRNLRTSGRKKLANAIILLLNSEDSENLNISSKSDCESSVPYSSEKALALMQQVKLSKNQYNTIHLQAKERKIVIYTSLQNVLEIGKDC